MMAGLLSLLANSGLFSPHPAAEPTEGGLVTSGPYNYIRHPIYTSVLVFVWAGIAAHWSILNAFFGVLIVTGSIMRLFCEERLVRARYPDYDAYASTTKRMIPFLF